LVQQEDGQYATIVHSAEQFTLQQCVEDGEMTIHIADDGVISQEHDTVEDTVTTEGVIMTEQVDYTDTALIVQCTDSRTRMMVV